MPDDWNASLKGSKFFVRLLMLRLHILNPLLCLRYWVLASLTWFESWGFWLFMSVDPDWVVIVCLCVVDARSCVLVAVVCRHHVRVWVCGECDFLLAVGEEPHGQMIRDR